MDSVAPWTFILGTEQDVLTMTSISTQVTPSHSSSIPATQSLGQVHFVLRCFAVSVNISASESKSLDQTPPSDFLSHLQTEEVHSLQHHRQPGSGIESLYDIITCCPPLLGSALLLFPHLLPVTREHCPPKGSGSTHFHSRLSIRWSPSKIL